VIVRFTGADAEAVAGTVAERGYPVLEICRSTSAASR